MEYLYHLNINDLAYGTFLRKLLEYVDSKFKGLDEDTKLYRIISLIKYKDDYKMLNEKGKQEFDKRIVEIDNLIKNTNAYISRISCDGFVRLLAIKNDLIHSENKFELFERAIKYNKGLIKNEQIFKNIINNCVLPLDFLLKFKNVVNEYNSVFKTVLLEHPETFQLLIEEFDVENKDKKQHLFFPKFSENEFENWLDGYLNSKYLNLNFLCALDNHRDNNQSYFLSTKDRIKVRNKIKEENKRIFKKDFVYEKKIAIIFDKNQKEVYLCKRNDSTETISFSPNWIQENLDYPTLLNNLIYVFSICDEQMRIKETYNKNNNGAIYNSLQMNLTNQYGSELFFVVMQRRQLIFNSYVINLNKHWKIRIEDVYKWFIEKYLKEEFKLENFVLNFELENSSYSTKASRIFIQIDSLLKQYSLFVENGYFDNELIKISKSRYKYDQYPSLITNKYYSCNEKSDISYLMFLLFSDQSMLNYVSSDLHDGSFAELISRNDIKANLFGEYNKNKLNFLLKNEIIEIKDGSIKFVSPSLIVLLYQFYTVGFVNYNNLSKTLKKDVDYLVEKNYLTPSSHFFSKEESDLFSFYLRDEKFSNALALRNVYEHGDAETFSEEEHKNCYLIGLRLLGIVIIKINDELTQKFTSDNKNTKFD